MTYYEKELEHYLNHRNEVIDRLIKLLLITKEHAGGILCNDDLNVKGMLDHIIEYDTNAAQSAQMVEFEKLKTDK